MTRVTQQILLYLFNCYYFVGCRDQANGDGVALGPDDLNPVYILTNCWFVVWSFGLLYIMVSSAWAVVDQMGSLC